MVRSLQKLLQIDLGFVPERALSFSVDLVDEKYPTTSQPRRSTARSSSGSRRCRASRPRARSTTVRWSTARSARTTGSLVEGQPLDRDSVTDNSISVNWEVATPDYFRAVGTRLLEGRTFTEHDTAEAPRS